jgi:hypothetical protein
MHSFGGYFSSLGPLVH